MKKICVFTGARSEYGLLKPLMDEIASDKDMLLQIIASGMHLSPEFGLTYKEIEKDGFEINEKIEILLSSDTPVGISKSIGLGLISFSESLQRLKPDMAVILGDRFETLAFAIACYVSLVPIAHLYGGETTEGAFDEGFRHSITKMSFLHFTAIDDYRKRVIQLGESPDMVFNVGALGIDNIKKMRLLSKKDLEQKLNLKFKEHNLLITFHPVTLEEKVSRKQFAELLKAVDELKDTMLIFTKANADAEGRRINSLIDEYTAKNKDKGAVFDSMGQLLYLSAMQYVDAVVGNSSSGIIEAPSFNTGTINIGDRQRGRVKSDSVIDCKPYFLDIKKAFEVLYSEEFQKQLKTAVNPYGNGTAAKKIKSIIKSYKIDDKKKQFYDIGIKKI